VKRIHPRRLTHLAKRQKFDCSLRLTESNVIAIVKMCQWGCRSWGLVARGFLARREDLGSSRRISLSLARTKIAALPDMPRFIHLFKLEESNGCDVALA
jgi:hypothetical protein